MANSLESSGIASTATSSASTPSKPASSTGAACAASANEALTAHARVLEALALDANQLLVLIDAVADHNSDARSGVLLGLAEKLATALRDGMDESAFVAGRLAAVGGSSMNADTLNLATVLASLPASTGTTSPAPQATPAPAPAASDPTTAMVDCGNFGPSGPRLVIAPGTPIDDLLSDALCLLGSGVAVLNTMTDDAGVPATLFAALYLLRQAQFTLGNAQLTEDQGRAVRNVK